ncbi:CHIA-like protein, partial [Mya arenaria]
ISDAIFPYLIRRYAKVNKHKITNPKLKTLLAIGGWSAGSEIFSNMTSSPASRQVFVTSSIRFLRDRNFDGLDMDWEYPARRGGKPEDKANLVALLSELHSAFEQDSYQTGLPRLLLTAAVPAGKSNIDAGYDVPNVARSLDFISIMTYDLHGSWDHMTGHNSPLYGRVGESPEDSLLNMDWSVKYWQRMGAPKHKLIVGFGLYGRSFTLQNPANHGFGALTTGGGRPGKYSNEPGFMAYYEICEELNTGAVRVWNNEHKVPYIHKGDLWVGYDDEESIREKVRWVKNNHFGGIMVWSLALDDFGGHYCKKGPYPLLTAINVELGAKPAALSTAHIMDSVHPLHPSNHIVTPSNAHTIDTPHQLHTSNHIVTPDVTIQNMPTVMSPIIVGNTVDTGHQTHSMPAIVSDPGNRATISINSNKQVQDRPNRSSLSNVGVGNVFPADFTNSLGNFNLSNSHASIPLNLVHDQPPSVAPTHTVMHHGTAGMIGHHAQPVADPPRTQVGFANALGNSRQSLLPLHLVHDQPPSVAQIHPVMDHGPAGMIGHHAQPVADPPQTQLGLGNALGNSRQSLLPLHLAHDQPPSVAQIHPVMDHGPPGMIGHHAQPVTDTPLIVVDTMGHHAPGPEIHVAHSPVGLPQTPNVDIHHANHVNPALDQALAVDASHSLHGLPPVDISLLTRAASDIPVAAAIHQSQPNSRPNFSLKDVRPAPPSRPFIEISSNSSSSSSSSSSESSSNSRTINIGGSPNLNSIGPTLHDLLSHGGDSASSSSSSAASSSGRGVSPHGHMGHGHSIPVKVVDNPRTFTVPPGSSVEAVIPINSIDNLAEVLASLGSGAPSAPSHGANSLNPGDVLQQLSLSNILGGASSVPQINASPSHTLHTEPITPDLSMLGVDPMHQEPHLAPTSNQVTLNDLFGGIDILPHGDTSSHSGLNHVISSPRRQTFNPSPVVERQPTQQDQTQLRRQLLLRQLLARQQAATGQGGTREEQLVTAAERRARLLAQQRARQRLLLQRQRQRQQQQQQLLLQRRRLQQQQQQLQQQQQQQQLQQATQRQGRPVDVGRMSDSQLRRVINNLDGATLRRLITSGRLSLAPNIERPRQISLPQNARQAVTQPRTIMTRATGFGDATLGGNNNNRFSANVVRNAGTGRGVVLISNNRPTIDVM